MNTEGITNISLENKKSNEEDGTIIVADASRCPPSRGGGFGRVPEQFEDLGEDFFISLKEVTA